MYKYTDFSGVQIDCYRNEVISEIDRRYYLRNSEKKEVEIDEHEIDKRINDKIRDYNTFKSLLKSLDDDEAIKQIIFNTANKIIDAEANKNALNILINSCREIVVEELIDEYRFKFKND